MTDTTATPPAITAGSILSIANNIVQGVTEHEVLINTIAGMAGILPEVALAEKCLPLLAAVLQFLQDQSGKSLPEVFQDLLNHLTPGQPNAPALTGIPEAG